MRLVAILVAFVVLSVQALALETLSSAHFSVEYAVVPKEECFTGGEKVNVRYEILPKSSAYRALLGGDNVNPRSYYFKTELNDASWRLCVDYYQGGAWDEGMSGKEVSIEAKYFEIGGEVKGIEKVSANLTAVVPVCGVRLCNFTAISASCEDCEKNALVEVKICVANENAFKSDIKSLRAKMSELEQKLKAENLYSEEDFRKVRDTIDSAEGYLMAKKFLDANARLLEAENLLKQLLDLTNKKLAENLYSNVNSKLSEVQRMLLNSSLLLEKLKTHGNYTQYFLEQKAFEDEFNALKDSMKSVETMMNNREFTKAIETLNKVEANATSLKARIESFTSLLTSELEKVQVFPLPLLSLSLSHLTALGAAIAALVAIFVGLKIRRRKRWDELR